MRISVCEFLRVRTQHNWFYMNPGHWGSDHNKQECLRISEDRFELRQGTKVVDRFAYFEGLPSNVVRARVRGTDLPAKKLKAKKKRKPQ